MCTLKADMGALWVDAHDRLRPKLVDRQHIDVSARRGEPKHVREGVLEGFSYEQDIGATRLHGETYVMMRGLQMA